MKYARFLIAPLAALTLLAGAPAWAQTAALAPIAISADLQHDLAHKWGDREAGTLRAMLTDDLRRAFEHEGVSLTDGGGVRVVAEIRGADPNRPTLQEMTRNSSLSYAGSFSTGGADLHANVHGPNGAVHEVSYRFYSANLEDVRGIPTTWSDAEYAMDVFARRVALAVKQAQ